MKQRTILSFLLMCIGIFVSGLYGPWFAPIFFIILFTIIIQHTRKEAMINGLLAFALVYLVMAAWFLGKDASGLIEKTGNLLGGLSPVLMVVITTVIGSITGLLSAWLGQTIGHIIRSSSK